MFANIINLRIFYIKNRKTFKQKILNGEFVFSKKYNKYEIDKNLPLKIPFLLLHQHKENPLMHKRRQVREETSTTSL